jgi:PPK2 family polyphosphate:nucleotide phosphotransferase
MKKLKERQIKDVCEQARKLAHKFCVSNGDSFHMRDWTTNSTLRFGKKNKRGKRKAKRIMKRQLVVMSELQERLYAEGKQGLVILLQAPDAAGKDSLIKHVMSGLNPQGCQVFSFKAPSPEELDEDFLRRCIRCLPRRGRIGIMNRSYYEEILTVKIHPEILAKQKLRPELVTKHIWVERAQDMRFLERYLERNGFTVLKFYLNLSMKVQKRRFFERLEIPAKNRKASAADFYERTFFRPLKKASEVMIRDTARKGRPWYVLPADHKWFTRLIFSSVVVSALAKMDPQYPTITDKQRKELAKAFHADTKKHPVAKK